MTGMTEEQALKLEDQANARIAAQHANKNAPGIGLCIVTPHQLLEMVEAWRTVCVGAGETKCDGFEIEPGVFSGCDQSAGDCPVCGE